MTYTKLLKTVQDRVDTVGIDQTKKEMGDLKMTYSKPEYMTLKDLLAELTAEPGSSLTFVANVIFERYNTSRKKMLQGLYNIVNGGPRHYWVPCHVSFVAGRMDSIVATPRNSLDNQRVKVVDLVNLPFYA